MKVAYNLAKHKGIGPTFNTCSHQSTDASIETQFDSTLCAQGHAFECWLSKCHLIRATPSHNAKVLEGGRGQDRGKRGMCGWGAKQGRTWQGSVVEGKDGWENTCL